MIDADQIMPLNFFSYGGVYSGEHHGMRYQLRRTGEKPDFRLETCAWQGPYSFAAVDSENKIFNTFDFSEDGRKAAIDWLMDIYDREKETWESAPSILEAPIDLNAVYSDKGE